MTIVKNIVEQSGGKVHVYSEGLGSGSYFCFSLKMREKSEIQNEILPHPVFQGKEAQNSNAINSDADSPRKIQVIFAINDLALPQQDAP